MIKNFDSFPAAMDVPVSINKSRQSSPNYYKNHLFVALFQGRSSLSLPICMFCIIFISHSNGPGASRGRLCRKSSCLPLHCLPSTLSWNLFWICRSRAPLGGKDRERGHAVPRHVEPILYFSCPHQTKFIICPEKHRKWEMGQTDAVIQAPCITDPKYFAGRRVYMLNLLYLPSIIMKWKIIINDWSNEYWL